MMRADFPARVLLRRLRQQYRRLFDETSVCGGSVRPPGRVLRPAVGGLRRHGKRRHLLGDADRLAAVLDRAGRPNATAAGDDPACAASGRTLWYTYTAQRSGPVDADPSGSSLPWYTYVGVYTGSPGNLTQVACHRAGRDRRPSPGSRPRRHGRRRVDDHRPVPGHGRHDLLPDGERRLLQLQLQLLVRAGAALLARLGERRAARSRFPRTAIRRLGPPGHRDRVLGTRSSASLSGRTATPTTYSWARTSAARSAARLPASSVGRASTASPRPRSPTSPGPPTTGPRGALGPTSAATPAAGLPAGRRLARDRVLHGRHRQGAPPLRLQRLVLGAREEARRQHGGPAAVRGA